MNLDKTNNNTKPKIVLLGDGFFARGFLHNINFNKFHITQIYKDPFINPQDIMYSLQRNIRYNPQSMLHLRDFFTRSVDHKIQTNINSLEINQIRNIVTVNNQSFPYNHLVIGLGSHKSLNQWKDEINSLVSKPHMMVGIVGIGPTGIELGTILSKYSNITMFDMLPKSKVLDTLRPATKDTILGALEERGIHTHFAKPYDSKEYNFDKVLFCGGSRMNSLVKDTGLVVNEFMQANRNIYLGGDCVETGFPKTAQVAYQQGVYVAKYLNGDIPYSKPFNFVSKGTAINIGDKKVIIEGHPIMWDGVYPDFIMKLYSLFCI